MQTHTAIEVQGHRGARGLLPENTLSSFEIALDVGVTSIESDVHLTSDDVPVLFHDARISERVCTMRPGQERLLVRSLSLEQLRGYRVDALSHPPMPLATRFAGERGFDPYAIPTLAELFDFVAAYVGCMGEPAGKTNAQRKRAGRLIFDLELKRTPFEPETIGDGFTGAAPALLESQVVAAIQRAGVQRRARLRSFDHRSAWAIKQLDSTLQTGLLIHNTVPMQIGTWLRAAQAEVYCPDYSFVDAEIVREVHAAGMRVIPYTVNQASAWERLIAWGVDGITTDFPDRLIDWLNEHGLSVS